MNGTRMRILLADRQVLVRDALAALMTAAGLPRVNQSANLADVLVQLAAHPVDLAVFDSAVVGLDDIPAVLAVAPKLRFGVMTGGAGRDQVEAVLRAGALGVISKTMPGDAFIAAVQDMLAGKQVMLATVASTGHHDMPYALTRRELDVLRGLFAGKSNKEIGRDLELQEVTVKLHVKTLSRKLGAKNRTHATVIARNEGLV